MKGLLNKYTFEFLDIQTNKVETKKYSNVLSNKEFLKIRFENLKSLKIKTYSFYKIMSLIEMYPEENILFLYEKPSLENLKINSTSSNLNYDNNINNNEKSEAFKKIQQSLEINEGNYNQKYIMNKYLMKFYKYIYYIYIILGLIILIHLIFYILSDYFNICLYIFTCIILLIFIFYLSYIGIYKYNGFEKINDNINEDDINRYKKLIYNLNNGIFVLTLINILIIHFKKLETEKLFNYIKDYMWLMNFINLLILFVSALAIIFFDKLNDVYYTKINMEMENFIS